MALAHRWVSFGLFAGLIRVCSYNDISPSSGHLVGRFLLSSLGHLLPLQSWKLPCGLILNSLVNPEVLKKYGYHDHIYLSYTYHAVGPQMVFSARLR
jgi:hypothetical protein